MTVTQLLVHALFGNGAPSGSFSRGAALATVVVATEKLVYAKLSAKQKEAVHISCLGTCSSLFQLTEAGKSLCYFILPTCF